MFVYFSQIKEVSSLCELPKGAIIKQIDGNSVDGMCGVCGKPVFSLDDKIQENENYWHTECGQRT